MPYVTVRHTCGSAPRSSVRGRWSSNVRSAGPTGTTAARTPAHERHDSRGIHDMSAMRKMGVYLGLLEDADGDYAEADRDYDEPVRRADAPADEAARPVANLAERRRPAARETQAP